MTNHPPLLSPSHPTHKQLHQVNHHHHNPSSSSQASLHHVHSSSALTNHHHHAPSSSSASSSLTLVPQSPTKSKKVSTSNEHHPLNSAQHISSIAGLWMLVDGIGLAIITAATILEGIELWKGVFEANWGYNSGSLLFWLCGRSSQIIGLLFLIGK